MTGRIVQLMFLTLIVTGTSLILIAPLVKDSHGRTHRGSQLRGLRDVAELRDTVKSLQETNQSTQS